MFSNSSNFLMRIRDEEGSGATQTNVIRFLKRIHAEEAGITALETAIILIAFVVVASVFAFTMLSAGTFSTERGKEAIYAGLAEVQSSMEVKGSIIAVAAGTQVTELVFTVSNVLNGEPVNLSPADPVIVIEYRDASQRATFETWTVDFKVQQGEDNTVLEAGELAEIVVPLDTLTTPLGPNTTFVLEVKPPSGAVLNLQRTTPAFLDPINDLQ